MAVRYSILVVRSRVAVVELLAVLAIVLLSSCAEKHAGHGAEQANDSVPPPNDTSHQDPPIEGTIPSAEPLKASRAFVGAGTWGRIAEVVVLGDSLFAYDLYGPPAVTVLDRTSGGVIGTFGRSGAGPGEFRDVSDVFRDEGSPGQFWVYDAGARRLSLYGSTDSGWVGLLRTTPVEIRGYVPYLRIGRRGLIAAGIFDGGAPVVLTDSIGAQVHERLGTYPTHAPGDSLRTQLNVNRPQVTYRPGGDKIALAYMHFNLIQLYDLKSGLVVSVTGPDPFEPRAEDLLDPNPKKFAYAKVRSTARYVYALFCGCTNADRSQPLRLQVYSWTGQLVAVLPIDHRSWQWVFDVSPDDRFIYTKTDDPYPQILETALPPYLHTETHQ